MTVIQPITPTAISRRIPAVPNHQRESCCSFLAYDLQVPFVGTPQGVFLPQPATYPVSSRTSGGGAGTLLHTLRRTSPHALRVPPFPYTHLVCLWMVLVCPRSDQVRKGVLPRNLGARQRCPLSQPLLQPNRVGPIWVAKLTCGNQTL